MELDEGYTFNFNSKVNFIVNGDEEKIKHLFPLVRFFQQDSCKPVDLLILVNNNIEHNHFCQNYLHYKKELAILI